MPDQVVAYLDEFVRTFDTLRERFGTVDDCYVTVAAGVQGRGPFRVIKFNILLLKTLTYFTSRNRAPPKTRRCLPVSE
jgi:hypothetical protein